MHLRSPGAEFTNGCKLSVVGAGNVTQVLCKSSELIISEPFFQHQFKNCGGGEGVCGGVDVDMHRCACGGQRLRLDFLSSCSSPYFLAWISHWPGTELTG